MDGVFWSGELGFVCDRSWEHSHFPDARKIAPIDVAPMLVASGRLPGLGPAPEASWLIARLFHLTGERLGFESHDRLRNDGGGVPLKLIAFTRVLKPVAFLFFRADSTAITLSGECALEYMPRQIVDAFLATLLDKPLDLTVCKLITIDTDPPDLPLHRRGKAHIFGWDGKNFLGYRIDEEQIFAREAAKSAPAGATENASAEPNGNRIVIEISETLVPSINGTVISTAPSVRELRAILGSPSRILEPKLRAPVGHRNNRLHIYDALGLVFWEHHYTRRIDHCKIVLCADDLQLVGDQSPPQLFPGTLRVAGYLVPRGIVDRENVLNACPILRPLGLRGSKPGSGFAVYITSAGYQLPGGGRTKRERLQSLDLSWPHDPWGEPVRDHPS